MIQRLRRLPGTKNSPMQPRTGTANGHAVPVMAAVVTGAAVWMVICEVAPVEPGVTVGGANVAVAPGGSPVAVRVTTPV